MVFSSPAFILLFLPLAFFIYFYLNRLRLASFGKAWLVVVSLFFYSYWNVLYLPVLLGSIYVNFFIGTRLTSNILKHSPHLKKSLLISGIIANIVLLGYFKYVNFLVDNINAFFGVSYIFPEIILPLGISFFTFTQIAYLIVYGC